MVVRELLARIGFKVDGSGIDHAERKIDDFKKKARETNSITGRLADGIKTALIGAATVGAAVAGVQLFRVNAEFERLSAAMETVTGSAQAAEQELAWIEDFASETPYQLSQIIDGFIKLKARGMDPNRETMRSLGNTASAMGKDLDQMIEAVADAITGEFERLKEFGIKASSEGDRVKFTFNGVTTTVKKNATEIQKYLVNIGQTEFAGAMDKQMQTLGGVLSNLVDWLEKAARMMGDAGLKAAAKDAMRAIIDLIKGSKDAIVVVGKMLGGAMSVLAGVLQFVADNLSAVKVMLMVTTGALVAVGVQALIASEMFTLAAAKALLLNAAVAMLPVLVGALIILWGLLIEDFIIWLEKGDESKTLIGEWQRQFPSLGQVLEDVRILWNGLTDVVADFIEVVAKGEFWDRFITGLKNFGSETMALFKHLFGWILLEITSLFITIGKAIAKKAADLWFPIEDAFRDTVAKVERFFTDLIAKIKRLIKQAVNAVVNLPAQAKEKLKDIPGVGKALEVGDKLTSFSLGGVLGGESGGAAKDIGAAASRNVRNSSRRVDVGGITLVQRDGESQQEFASRVREEMEKLEDSENRRAEADAESAFAY